MICDLFSGKKRRFILCMTFSAVLLPSSVKTWQSKITMSLLLSDLTVIIDHQKEYDITFSYMLTACRKLQDFSTTNTFVVGFFFQSTESTLRSQNVPTSRGPAICSPNDVVLSYRSQQGKAPSLYVTSVQKNE